jgi:DNA repair photolyase
MVKPGAAELLRRHLDNRRYVPVPITLSGNTDCYQPLERKYRVTRSLLEVMLEYRHPVGLITKNSLVLRDLDLLAELARHRLVHVMVSVTSLRDGLRLLMEPRTATYRNRLHAVRQLAQHGVPVGVMNAPVIPGLNSDEVPRVIAEAAEAGALTAGYTILRLNGEVKHLFRDWLYRNLPDAADKIWNQTRACHGGRVSDSRFGVRMRGEGPVAESIRQLFHAAKKKYLAGRRMPEYNLEAFRRPVRKGEQLGLF